ncbi:MAG: proteobacterial dedicated sortase system response regulator [Gammaproteobacteria bacterium]|nr:proteobacterial dedicated sortase system response regulator [Gammaproteobacteria bacterium]NIN61033.1 proteobacterial dedicated sortase system response regulator [Gammaproteobacteria bacterium]NIO62656.1 proteobacterial dedicated sortase system response regulator [Gammaproteobacteria bacterium]NIP49427.1 proteobacterial dedicated sortase system response regulator [Gammaproteobacteria bacterium]NIQ10651.1 proteobacterial dedicated sortase system response regulator [Gammaproteobacteria bacteri
MVKTVALVEDESDIRENYSDALQKQGYQVSSYTNRKEALKQFSQKLPDLILIDVGLGEENEGGFDLCRELRNLSEIVPIIFLTARDSDLDTISGLRLGADDYLTKDITMPQLLARIAALFRRIDAFRNPVTEDDVISHGHLMIDKNRLLLEWKSSKIDVTLTEFWIVYSLAYRPGHVKSREQLMSEAKMFVDEGTITSHIKRIRKKFITVDKEFDCIETIYGLGYRWNL